MVQLRQNLEEGSTLEITYDLKDSGVSYKTATNFAIFPENRQEDIDLCAQRLGVDLKKKFVFKTNDNVNKKGAVKHPFPTPISI